METKLKDKKVTHYEGRILCNNKGMSTEELKKIVLHYLQIIATFDNFRKCEVNQVELNKGIRFRLFNLTISVDELFEFYNKIAKEENLQVYSKVWYNHNGFRA